MSRKNSGLSGMNFEEVMRQQAFQSVEQPLYCRFCGIDVKTPSKNSPGGSGGNWRRNLDWEIENQSHVTCANKHRGGRR
jgi:hypothetical protein